MPSESLHPSSETTAEPSAGVLGSLGIHGSQFLGHLLNFLVIVLIMWRWVYRPLIKKMDERSAKIAEGLSSAEEATKRLAEVKQDAQQLLREAQLQAEASMKAAIAEAEGVRSERLAKTEREIEALLERSRHEIAQDRATAFVSLKKELADMVMLATGKIVGSLTDKQVDEKAVAQALVDLERV